jgi:Tail-tube assembly protein
MAETTTMPTPPTGVPRRDYSKKQYEENKYSVKGYEYPSDLMGNTAEYGGNYVIFYINVAEDSKMVDNKENPSENVTTVDIADNERVKKAITGLNLSSVGAIGVGTAAGALGGTIAGQVLGLGGGRGPILGGAIGGGSAAVISTQASSFTRSQKRLQTAIALHTPNDLSIRYSAGWGEEETFGFSALAAAGQEIASVGKAIYNSFNTDNPTNVDAQGKQIGGIVAAATLKGVPGTNSFGIASGLAPNPKKEQMFSGVDFRTFTFNYKFAPRSSIEAKNVINIINTFKYHMHPEYKDTKGFLFLYPSEFDIVYYHGSEENLNIHRHTSCVLTDMNINYSPNGVFNTFSDGMPTQIDVQMTFKELTILTKELIKDGL